MLIPALSFLMASCGFSQDRDVMPASVNESDATWTLLAVNSPSMRSGYAMAYDTSQQKIIAYGGRTGFPDFFDINETWAFDYKSGVWSNLKPANSPPWRAMHAMVYDPVENRTLMFGGSDFVNAFDDLWEYDFLQNTWLEITTDSSPAARQMHGMVYNPDRESVVMFGGRREGGGAFFQDGWELRSATNTWERLPTRSTPPVSDHVKLAYYQSIQKLILFSGPDAYVLGNGQVRPQSTWAYDFSDGNWSNLNPVNSPDGDHSTLVYDPHRDKLILLGNSRSSDGMFTWEYDFGTNEWTNITPDVFPDIYIEHDAMVYIADHNAFIQYGGCCSDTTLRLTLQK